MCIRDSIHIVHWTAYIQQSTADGVNVTLVNDIRNDDDAETDENGDGMDAMQCYYQNEVKWQVVPSYPCYLPLMDFLHEWG